MVPKMENKECNRGQEFSHGPYYSHNVYKRFYLLTWSLHVVFNSRSLNSNVFVIIKR